MSIRFQGCSQSSASHLSAIAAVRDDVWVELVPERHDLIVRDRSWTLSAIGLSVIAIPVSAMVCPRSQFLFVRDDLSAMLSISAKIGYQQRHHGPSVFAMMLYSKNNKNIGVSK